MASTETRPAFRLPWTAGTGESDEHDSEEAQAPQVIDTAAPAPTPDDSAQPGAAPARRATKFMAELSRAMQAAAEHARNETMARFEVDAKAVVEEIHTSATSEVSDLRRKADDDVAAIREWSKAEIARVREQTESRVATRKSGLDAEMEAHAASVEARAERVTVVVAAFEADMTAFFERLNAEEDPTRIATMAETMPDPPSLDDVAASIGAAQATATAAPATFPKPATEAAKEPEPTPAPAAEIDFAAAEAEAASFSGDLGDDDEDGTSARAATGAAGDAPAEPMATFDPAQSAARTGADAPTTTRIVVVGLVSVASIANFKRSLTRIGGVWSIGVSSGPSGEFVFNVSHDPGLQLSASIISMEGFASQVTGESDGEIQVSAQDRDAAD